MTKDNVADRLLTDFWLTFYSLFFFTVFKSKNFFLFISKDLFKNNIKNLKWSSKLKTKRERMRFEVIMFCKISVLHNY